jgi:hypothetical protein
MTRNRSEPATPRLARVILLGIVGGLTGAFLLVLPLLPSAVPIELPLFFSHPLLRVIAIALVLVLGPTRIAACIPRRLRERLRARAQRIYVTQPFEAARVPESRAASAVATSPSARLEALDRLAAKVLSGPATVAALALAIVFLAGWIPHYLTWPWWADIDQFAVSAQAWSMGILPYSDLVDFDFPGPIYLHFLLGKLFGWGSTVAFHAVDVALVAILGVALATWSRRLFGSALPGLVSFLTFLGMYLSLDFSLVGQRDWHAPLCVVLGLFALELWPGHAGRALAAGALGLALAVRPHELVFLPAMVAAVDEGARRPGEPWHKTIKPLLEWSVFLTVSVALAFLPLVLAGTFDDLVVALCSARRGPYNVNSWFWFSFRLEHYFHEPGTIGVLAAVVLLAVARPAALRGPARTWALALLGAFFYKPMSLWPHQYLDQPIALVWAINLAIVVAWLLTTPRLAALARLAGLVVVLAACVPGVPRFSSAGCSLQALGPLLRGEDPALEPPGCIKQFASRQWPSDRYRWEDYRDVLAYLRESTPADCRVANLLWNVPYPPVNGPTGHLTPFPAAGGYIHLWMVEPTLIDEYLSILRQNREIIVVWSPGKPNRFFPELDCAVREAYCPAARFGAIEVWRHRRAAPCELNSTRAQR